MGFWSSIASFGKSVLSGIGRAISSGIGKVVSGVASWVAENIFNLRDAGSYNSETASVDETKKINELLNNCIESYRKEAEKYDEMAEVILEEQFNLLRNKLIEINEISSEKIIEDYIFKSFENNLLYIKKDLEKIYSKQIANVFSLNNNNLLDILKLDKGKEKNDKLKKLGIETITKANNQLMEELSNFVLEQQVFISERLNEYMENVKRTLKATELETQRIIDAKAGDKNSYDYLSKKYTTLLKQLELLEKILEREN